MNLGLVHTLAFSSYGCSTDHAPWFFRCSNPIAAVFASEALVTYSIAALFAAVAVFTAVTAQFVAEIAVEFTSDAIINADTAVFVSEIALEFAAPANNAASTATSKRASPFFRTIMDLESYAEYPVT